MYDMNKWCNEKEETLSHNDDTFMANGHFSKLNCIECVSMPSMCVCVYVCRIQHA